MDPQLTVKSFDDLTRAEFTALRQLQVTAHQEVLGKSFLESIEDWEKARKDQVLALCFLHQEAPVGLTLFRRIADAPDGAASIHGLKIALPFQGRGWGHRAFRLAVEALQTTWPDTKTLKLAVDAENTAAIAVYRAFGMQDSGPVFQGPNGLEHHMEILLT